MIIPIAVILTKMTSNYNAHAHSSPDSLKRKGVAITQSHHLIVYICNLYYTYQQSGIYKNRVKNDKNFLCNFHSFILWTPRKSRAGNFKMMIYQKFLDFLAPFPYP